jgi:DNA-binding transcriptional ArsR family regulator
VFAALADPTRRGLAIRLTSAAATVGELAEPHDMSLQAISKAREDARGGPGLVTRSKDAQRRPVHLDAAVFDLMTNWIERYRREAEERYRRRNALLGRLADDKDQKQGHTKDASRP